MLEVQLALGPTTAYEVLAQGRKKWILRIQSPMISSQNTPLRSQG